MPSLPENTNAGSEILLEMRKKKVPLALFSHLPPVDVQRQ